MGGVCCSSFNKTDADSEIADYMLKNKEANKAVKKLLLLGSGSSGKSTLFKQLKCIFNPWGLDASEFIETAHSIRTNIVLGILKLLQKSQDLYDSDPNRYSKCYIDLDADPNLINEIQVILQFRHETFENMDDAKWDQLQRLGEAIDYIWKNVDGIRHTFNERGSRFSFADNMEYFFDKCRSIFLEEFYPTHEDVLKCRIRTTGMVEITYEIKDSFFNIYDVGGQRNERKKWIHSFENVTAVIYVAALSHFDAVCFEDESQNAMHESISLFNEICNSKWFRKTAMILFLNKSDLFREKLMECLNIDKCFNNQQQKGGINSINGNGWDGEEYHGPCYKESDKLNNSNINQDQQYFEHCYKSQVDFIAKLYYDQRQNEDKKIFTHITNATDRTNVEKVFWDCQNIVIRKNLSTGGFT
mmetsp:Transcript_67426/g.60562  ORF Transcript_67426/g.60562 Transcript_67426/m.60562 type:complete len:415 (+) Transcript_67426:104-1348(+)